MAKPTLQTVVQTLRDRLYKKAEQEAMQILQSNPLSTQAWVYLGEALIKQGFGQAARKVFNRASLLDPQAIWVDKVHSALSHVEDGVIRPAVERLLAVKQVTVAAAIMTRNEARCIDRCIRSLLDAVDEIIVLDSGSTDGTLEILAQFPQVKVLYDVALEDDFAGKRNKGLAHMESDWVLWVDADEWLMEEDVSAIREVAGLFHDAMLPPVLNICQVNYIQNHITYEYSMPRLFQLRRQLMYDGRVHEQVVVKGQGMFESATIRHAVRVRLHHDGYEPHIMEEKTKLNRNLGLLRRMVEEEPNNPGWLLYYGREMLGHGDVDEALRILLEAEQKALKVPNFGRMLDIHQYLIKIYYSRQEYEAAHAVCQRSLDIHPNYPDALFWSAQIQMRQAVLLLQKSEKELNKSKESFSTYRGIVTADRQILEWKADLALADLAQLSGKQGAAIERYEQVLNKHPELEQVKRKLGKLKSST